MNIVARYMDRDYVLLQNIGHEKRFVGGYYILPGGYLAMEKGSANTFLGMIHDRSWIREMPFYGIEELETVVRLSRPTEKLKGMEHIKRFENRGDDSIENN